MKYIVGGRASGKTSAIIRESAKTGVNILCKDPKHRDRITDQARTMGVNIPPPICIMDVKNHHVIGIRCSSDHPLKVLIDDPMDMLRSLINDHVLITGCSIDADTIRDIVLLKNWLQTHDL